jgi:hypothetical protein
MYRVEMLDYLKNSKSKKEDVRVSVAEDENSPLDILNELVNDPSAAVRQALALNPSSSADILEILSNDKEEDVVIYLAGSQVLSSELVLKLSKHNSDAVRASIACNEKISVDILNSLSDDKSDDVLEELSRNINTPLNILLKLSKLSNRRILEGICRNPNSNSKILDMLSESECESVREVIAENINTSPSTLAKLAQDQYGIKLRVASNISTPESTLKILALDKDKYVKEAVKTNPSAKSINIKNDALKVKKFDVDQTAKILFELFNSDGGYIIETDVKKFTILILRSGSSLDNEYTLTIEKTKDHEDFEILNSFSISKDRVNESVDQFKLAIEAYLKVGGSKSSFEV